MSVKIRHIVAVILCVICFNESCRSQSISDTISIIAPDNFNYGYITDKPILISTCDYDTISLFLPEMEVKNKRLDSLLQSITTSKPLESPFFCYLVKIKKNCYRIYNLSPSMPVVTDLIHNAIGYFQFDYIYFILDNTTLRDFKIKNPSEKEIQLVINNSDEIFNFEPVMLELELNKKYSRERILRIDDFHIALMKANRIIP